MTCNHCEGTGFLNIHQVPQSVVYSGNQAILSWIKMAVATDCQICDCCGDGEGWHGTPGEHYTRDDPKGPYGPYSYNGGLCECH